jgi:hypothetical protein
MPLIAKSAEILGISLTKQSAETEIYIWRSLEKKTIYGCVPAGFAGAFFSFFFYLAFL